MNLAPIVLFVYNRLWHTQQTVESLQKNELTQESELFIYSDAPKNEEAKKDVNEVRKYIEKIDGFKKVTIIKREKNWGLAKSIIIGVTKIVNKYGKIIVLEDDLITSPYFLRFMNDSLDFYEKEHKVMHISAYIYPIDNNTLSDTYFIKPASCWGWATWDRAWKFYRKDTDYYINIFNKKSIKDFNLNSSYNYFGQIIANKYKTIDTWAIFWYASIYVNNGLSLHPKESFTHNIGHDGTGSNCKSSSEYNVNLIRDYPLYFETNIKESIVARQKIENYFNSLKIPFRKKIINKIINIIKNYQIILTIKAIKK